MLRVVTGTNTIMIRMDQNVIKSISVPEARVEFPTDISGRLWLHFAPHDEERYVSAVDVLEGRFVADRFAQRLVLIGTSAAGLLDLKTTPVDPAMPGVEVHAQILENILTGATLSSPSYAKLAELAARVPARHSDHHSRADSGPGLLLLFGGAIIALLIGTSWYFFTHEKLLIDFHLSAAVELADLPHAGVHQFRQGAGAAPPDPFGVLANICRGAGRGTGQVAGKAGAGRQQREMTIMFSDVRGFTTISESTRTIRRASPR